MRLKARVSRHLWLYLVILYACAWTLPASAQSADRVQGQCMEWLTQFSTYAKSLFVDDGTDERGDSIGHFREANVDVAMVLAFLHEYGEQIGLQLPQGVSYDLLKRMAMKSLRWEIAKGSGDNVYGLALTEEFLNFNLERYDEEGVGHVVEKAVEKGRQGQVPSALACAWAMMPLHGRAEAWQQRMTELSQAGHVATDFQSGQTEEQLKCVVALCHLMGKKPDATILKALTDRWNEVWGDVVSPMLMPNGACAVDTKEFGGLPFYAAMGNVKQNADALMMEYLLIDKLMREIRPVVSQKHQKHAKEQPEVKSVVRLATLLTTTWLLHDYYGNWAPQPSQWSDFLQRSMGTRILDSLKTVRSLNQERFAYFSWANLKTEPCISTPDGGQRNEWVAYQWGGHPYCIWATPGNALIAVGDIDHLDFYSNATVQKAGLETMEIDPKVIGKRKKKAKMKYFAVHVYFAGITEERARRLAAGTLDMSRDGWTIILTDDTDGTRYLLAFNTSGTKTPFQLPKELKKEEKDIVKMIVTPEQE